MYRTIIAGCDGGQRGRGAVSLAHTIASATGARLVLVGVHHHPPLPFPSTYADLRSDLAHQLKAVRDELAPEAIVQVAADLSPAHALRHIARFEDADLIVVGSRHRRRLQRILDSDHALQVLHGARCAVAVAPDPVQPHRELRTIGVGIDSTPESKIALGMAHELAERTGARLALKCVVDDTAPWWMDGVLPPASALQEVLDERLHAGHDLLHGRLESCEGVEAEGDVVLGDPAGELILASEDLDLLVLGSRRWGPVRRLALGSTSERVIRHAGCPVLVPPRHDDTEGGQEAAAAFEISVL
jgi:nucleotide-binding universal stress UspA family protein